MHSLPQEFLALCRQLGEAQQRCSAAMAAQAAQIDTLQAEVVRLRAAVMVRDTRLAMAQDEMVQLRDANPGLPRRKAMARHIGLLAERITALSRECLRWRQAAVAQGREGGQQRDGSGTHLPLHAAALAAPHAAESPAHAAPASSAAVPVTTPMPLRDQRGLTEVIEGTGAAEDLALDAHLAAADLVICQTGCISHDQYWRVQDHCRRTGKTCILVDQPLAVREAEVLSAMQPMVVLRMTRAQPAGGRGTGAELGEVAGVDAAADTGNAQ